MERYKKLAKNIGLVSLGSASSKLLNFLLLPLYTSILTSSEYGISDLIFTVVGLMLPFFSFVIYEPLMRFTLENKGKACEYFSSSVFVWTFGTILFLLLSPIFFFSKTLGPYYIFVVLYYITHSIYSILSYFCRGLEKVTHYSVSGVINTVTIIISNILFLAVFRWGIVGYLIAYILGQSIASVYIIITARIGNYFSIDLFIKHSSSKELLKYSIPMMPNSISWWISNYSDKYIMLMFHSAASMGVYSVSYKIPSLCSVMSSIFSTAWEISAVEEFGTNESKKMFSNVFGIYSGFLVITGSFLIISCKLLAVFLFKNDFFEAWHFVPFLMIGTIFHSLSGFMGTVFTSLKKTNSLFVSTIVGAFTNIILNILLIPHFAAYGASFATMISYIVVYIMRIVLSRKYFVFEMHTFQFSLCIIILFIQTALTIIQMPYWVPLNLFFLVVILAIEKNSFIALFNASSKQFKRLIHR